MEKQQIVPPFWVSEHLPAWTADLWLGFPLWQWFGLLGALFVGFFLKVTVEYLVHALKNLTPSETESLRHRFIVAIEKPIGLIAATAFWYFVIHHLKFQGDALEALTFATEVLFGASLIWAAYRLVDVLSLQLHLLAEKTENDFDDHLVPLLSKTLRVFIILLGSLVLIQNLGFNVMSLLAGLGLGGLAFALAAKDTAANLFGSLMILIDRPFRIGDWIVTSEGEGHVEEVGFRSTRIRTFYDSLISIPNSTLATINIDNMGQRSYRRIKEYISVTYDTSPEKMEAFLEGMKQIVLANDFTRKDKFHIVFNRFGASSLDILLYCFVQVEDWSEELYQRQVLFLEILRLAKNLNVEFAFPTQTLHVETFPEKKPTRVPIQPSDQELKKIPEEFAKDGALERQEKLGYYHPHFRTLGPGEPTSGS